MQVRVLSPLLWIGNRLGTVVVCKTMAIRRVGSTPTPSTGLRGQPSLSQKENRLHRMTCPRLAIGSLSAQAPYVMGSIPIHLIMERQSDGRRNRL